MTGKSPKGDIRSSRLFLFLGACLLAGCLLAPWIKLLLNGIGALAPELGESLDFPFHRIFSRTVMVTTLGGLLIFSRRLGFLPLVAPWVRRREGWASQLLTGFFLGVVTLLILILFLYAAGTRDVEEELPSLFSLIGKITGVLLAALLIGIVEEVFFRGVLLRSLMKSLPLWGAVVATSLFYSILHFFRLRGGAEPSGFHPLSGFAEALRLLEPFAQPLPLLPRFFGLFLVGVVLAYAALRTGALFLSIGLHAGWVFSVKMDGLFLDRAGRTLPWVFGGSEAVGGLLGWIFLLAMFPILKVFIEEKGWGKERSPG